MPQREFLARDLDGFLDALPPRIKTLSLDCFDTIVWRKVERPTDVFFNLQETSRWRAAGVTAALRAKAESAARAHKRLLSGRGEVSIEEIYRHLLPQASEAEIAAWVSEELAAEEAHTFVFEAVLNLMRRAYARGLRLVVVSDTYLSRRQLRRLLATRLQEDEPLVAQVYCSSDFGVSKVDGLFAAVLQQEKLKPQQMAHLGDSPQADLEAPGRLGIFAARLRHHAVPLASQLGSRANAALQLMPELRHRSGLPSAWHGVLAAHHDERGDVAQRIGYTALGPIFAAFARFLDEELRALRSGGAAVRAASLLRDGYLPARAYETFTGQTGCAQIQISRFTAIAAALRSRADVVRLLAGGVSVKSMPALLKQLLLPPQLAEGILARACRDADPPAAFARQVLRDDTLRQTLTESAALRRRLLTHVRSRTGLQRGETLVLVDLGYSGTVQTRLREVFRDEMDVNLRGLYLIASRAEANQNDRVGLIGPPWADERLVLALTAYIGLFEMMCAKAEPSTVDYTEAGDPVFGAAGAKSQQSAVVQTMQAACLRFIDDLRRTPLRCQPQVSRQELAWQAAAELGRLIYFPGADEIDCLSTFDFDFNLGTDLLLATADLQKGLSEYRREGFALMNRDFATMRVSYPMELRHMDVSLVTTLLSAQRFGCGITPAEASFRREEVPVLVANANSHSVLTARAFATHDGFFSLHLPMSASFDASVLWGRRYEWLQIDAVHKVSLADGADAQPLALGRDVVLDGVQQEAGGLLRCGEAGMMFLPACSPRDHGRYMVRVVFRPVALRVQPASPAGGEPAAQAHADAAVFSP
jgi:FMN phosphatase YigB (HAD superfamily)